MHWWDLNTKSFRRFSAIKNTYLHALVGPEHKIVLAIFSYQENLLTCIGGTLTKKLFVDFQVSRILIDMYWWDLNTIFWRFSAITNTYWHALVGLKHKIFSTIFSYQEYLFTCLGGTLTQNLFGEFPQYKKCILTCIGGTLPQNLFGDFQLSRILFDMHWWDLNTKSFRRFSAIKNTYWHALVGPKHKILKTIFSYQEYLFTCIGGTWTQNLFGDIQLSRKLIDMLWRDFNTKSFWRFPAIKNTYWHALVGPKHKIF